MMGVKYQIFCSEDRTMGVRYKIFCSEDGTIGVRYGILATVPKILAVALEMGKGEYQFF
jgi:hypothetical protein